VAVDPQVQLDPPGSSFLTFVAGRANVQGKFYNVFTFTAGHTDPPVLLVDGGVLVAFTGTVSHDLYNTPAPAGGPCVLGDGSQVWVHFGIPGFNDVHSRHTKVDWVVAGRLHIPTKAAGQPAKAALDDSSMTPTNPANDPC